MNELQISNLNDFQLFMFKSSINNNLEIDSNFFDIVKFLNDNTFNITHNKVSFSNNLRINKDFFSNNLKLEDVYVSLDDICIYKTSPFNIPVVFKDDFKLLGQVEFENDDNKTYFTRVNLDKYLYSYLVSIYAHEITHTQIEKNRYKLLNNYFNREVLSIFIELVISEFCNNEYNTNTFNSRLNLLTKTINSYLYKENMKLRCYLESTFKALHLYDIYTNGDSNLKKEMLNMCEKVFKENITVEDVLDKYEVDYKNSVNLKYLKR